MADSLTEVTYYLDKNMAEPAGRRLAGGEIAVLTTRCPDHEPPNEDAAGVIAIGVAQGVLVVADGFGGHPGGDEASRLAVRSLAHSVREATSMLADRDSTSSAGQTDTAQQPLALRPAIITGIDTANVAVRNLGIGAATTLLVVEIQRETIRPYHVGDSELLVTGQRGKLKFRTVSHSPAGYAVEAGVVDADEALSHEERHVVSNMVGSAEMRIEVGAPLKLAARDTVILGSDGLFDNLTEDEIIALARCGPLPEAVSVMAAAARQRMLEPQPDKPSKLDDLTIIAYRPTPPKR